MKKGFFRTSGVIVSILLILGSGCSTTDKEANQTETEVSYSGTGYFSFGFEHSGFRPDEIEEEWWISGGDELQPIWEDWNRRRARNEIGVYPVYLITVEGTYSNKGLHGHLGMYDRLFVVDRLNSFKFVEKPMSNQSGDDNSE